MPKTIKPRIPRTKILFGKRYEHLGHSAHIAIAEEMARDFKSVMKNKYAVHIRRQEASPGEPVYVVWTRRVKRC